MAMVSDKILIITAPSGAGKTSVTTHLLKKFPRLGFSVSAATRPRRENEINGVDYYFMSLEQFQVTAVSSHARRRRCAPTTRSGPQVCAASEMGQRRRA